MQKEVTKLKNRLTKRLADSRGEKVITKKQINPEDKINELKEELKECIKKE